MKAFATVAVAGLIAATSLTTTAAPAFAGGKHYKHNNWGHSNNWKKPRYHKKYYSSKGWNSGAALATGAIIGLTVGALATAPRYYNPPRVYTYAPPPPPPPPLYPADGYGYQYEYGYNPQHVSWCSRKYRSYNVQSNSWVGYDGYVHQCISPYS